MTGVSKNDERDNGKGYVDQLSGWGRFYRKLAYVLGYVGFVFSLMPALFFFALPDSAWEESSAPPTDVMKSMAAVVAVVTLAFLVAVGRLHALDRTLKVLRSQQRVFLWGGGAALFLLFTVGIHVKMDALVGMGGAIGMLLMLAGTLLFEPVIAEASACKEATDEAAEKKHRADVLEALKKTEPSRPEESGHEGFRLFCRGRRRVR